MSEIIIDPGTGNEDAPSVDNGENNNNNEGGNNSGNNTGNNNNDEGGKPIEPQPNWGYGGFSLDKP